MSALITAALSYVASEAITALLMRFGFVGAKAAAKKSSAATVPGLVLKAAKAGVKHLANNERAECTKAIKAIEERGLSGAQQDMLRRWP